MMDRPQPFSPEDKLPDPRDAEIARLSLALEKAEAARDTSGALLDEVESKLDSVTIHLQTRNQKVEHLLDEAVRRAEKAEEIFF